jgi:hypothetical protein
VVCVRVCVCVCARVCVSARMGRCAGACVQVQPWLAGSSRSNQLLVLPACGCCPCRPLQRRLSLRTQQQRTRSCGAWTARACFTMRPHASLTVSGVCVGGGGGGGCTQLLQLQHSATPPAAAHVCVAAVSVR